MDNQEYLKKAIAKIKASCDRKGKVIDEAEIAEKAGISLEILTAYLNGTKQIPDDFGTNLLSGYGIKIQHISWSTTFYIDLGDDDAFIR